MNRILSNQNNVLQAVRNYYAAAQNPRDNPIDVIYTSMGGSYSFINQIYLFFLNLLGMKSEQEVVIGKALNAYKVETFKDLKKAIYAEPSNNTEVTKIGNIKAKCPQFFIQEIEFIYKSPISHHFIGTKHQALNIDQKHALWEGIQGLIVADMTSPEPLSKRHIQPQFWQG